VLAATTHEVTALELGSAPIAGSPGDENRRQQQDDRPDGEDHVADDVDGTLPAVELGQDEPGRGLVQERGAGEGEPVGHAPAATPGPAGDEGGHGDRHHHAERDP
jgi:hypothetical protein